MIEADDFLADVSLIDANILWSPARGRDNGLQGTAHVEHRKVPADVSLYLVHGRKVGACMMWSTWTPTERLTELLRIAHQMQVFDGVPSAECHRALSVIPEYRASMVNRVPEWREEDDAGG